MGLNDDERVRWPRLKSGHHLALVRGLFGEGELAVVAAVTPDGYVKPLAILATAPELRDEIELVGDEGPIRFGWSPGRAARVDGECRRCRPPPWIDQHRLLYARALWYRRRPHTY